MSNLIIQGRHKGTAGWQDAGGVRGTQRFVSAECVYRPPQAATGGSHTVPAGAPEEAEEGHLDSIPEMRVPAETHLGLPDGEASSFSPALHAHLFHLWLQFQISID